MMTMEAYKHHFVDDQDDFRILITNNQQLPSTHSLYITRFIIHSLHNSLAPKTSPKKHTITVTRSHNKPIYFFSQTTKSPPSSSFKVFNVKTVLFAFAAVAAAGPAAPAAHGNQTVVTTTRVVQAYTTYCPEPTTLTLGVQTYTVTKPTTLTITDCPCTVVEPCHTCHAQPTGPVNPPVNPVNPPVNTPVAPVNPPVTNSPHPEVTPPVLVSSASERLVQFGAAVLGAAFVGVLAL